MDSEDGQDIPAQPGERAVKRRKRRRRVREKSELLPEGRREMVTKPPEGVLVGGTV